MKKNIPLAGLPRWAEIIFALFGVAILLPLILFIAVLIKITGKGPIIFSQRRMGVNKQEFIIYKFRTMCLSRSGLLITAANDNRITTLGKVLRKTKLDELPELWNIIKGDMSFVGPRPEVPEFVDLNNPIWEEILQARPGLTDPVTLKLRNEETLLASVTDKKAYYEDVLQPYKLNGYANFVKDRSWKSDIKIICRTIKLIVLPKIAYLPSNEEIRLQIIE